MVLPIYERLKLRGQNGQKDTIHLKISLSCFLKVCRKNPTIDHKYLERYLDLKILKKIQIQVAEIFNFRHVWALSWSGAKHVADLGFFVN